MCKIRCVTNDKWLGEYTGALLWDTPQYLHANNYEHLCFQAGIAAMDMFTYARSGWWCY